MGMLNQGTELKDVGLNANLRPNSVNVIGEQPNLYPYDAFSFDDPNRTESPTLGMSDGWNFNVGTIYLESLDTDLQSAIEQASITAEDNALKIKNTDGQVLITGDTVDILARELNLEADTISIKADKLVIYNPTDEDETEQLSEVLKIEGGDIYFGDYDNGAGMKWDQSAEEFDIKGSLSAGDININNRFVVSDTGEVYCADIYGQDISGFTLKLNVSGAADVGALTCNSFYSTNGIKTHNNNGGIKVYRLTGTATTLTGGIPLIGISAGGIIGAVGHGQSSGDSIIYRGFTDFRWNNGALYWTFATTGSSTYTYDVLLYTL